MNKCWSSVGDHVTDSLHSASSSILDSVGALVLAHLIQFGLESGAGAWTIIAWIWEIMLPDNGMSVPENCSIQYGLQSKSRRQQNGHRYVWLLLQKLQQLSYSEVRVVIALKFLLSIMAHR